MFKVKVCGVKDAQTAAFCCSVGVDAIGLNFYAKSRRFISPDQAKPIVEAMDESTLKVGLFVNQDAGTIVEFSKDLQLDAIQLHGNETIANVDELASLPERTKIIRAVRISKDNEQDAKEEIEAWSSCLDSDRIGAILLDPFVKNEYGGTGRQIDWEWLAKLYLPTDKPLILAGGLNPDNVANAISIFQPAGVDVAGGVEGESGNKDVKLIRKFSEVALKSFDRI